MPIYEFVCESCGPFEQYRALKDAGDPITCPLCQQVAQRVYSTSGVILASGAVGRRIEQSAEPTVVTRPVSEENSPHQTLQQSARGRPWQLGHAAHATPVKPGLQRI